MRFLRWISMLTVIAMLFAMLPATVAEDEIVIGMEESVDGEIDIDLAAFDDSSIALENGTFDLDGLEDKLLISEEEEYTEVPPASNASGDFDISEDGELIRYRGFARNVVIPNDVKRIGDWAFYEDTIMESVSIPDSVTYIGSYAFSGCTGLKSITIPDSVNVIGEDVFSSCVSLNSIHISNNLTILSSGFFSRCESLEQISLPGSIKKIEDYAFSGCASLKSITLPDGVTDIEMCAFRDCDSLESITIPSSVTFIDREAFFGSENVVIRGVPDSYAERFANVLEIPFNAPIVTINAETKQIYDVEKDEELEGLILYINQSYTINAIQRPADLTRTLVWSSSDTNVVKVDQGGTIKGVSQGIATITANTADGKGKAAQINIIVPEPTTITIDYNDERDEEDYKIILGKTLTICAYTDVPYQNYTEVDMTVTWSSSDSSIISIESTKNDKAILKGNKLGKAAITAATPDGGKASLEIEVIRPDAESIKIDQSGPIRLYPGQKCVLSTTITPVEAMPKLTWDSWDTGIATVDQDGMVTAVKPGETEISVESDNDLDYIIDLDDFIDIHVLTPPEKITLSKTEATLAVSDTLTLKKTLTPYGAETGFTWSSSNPSVATVSKKGVVTALKAGTATITVATDNGKSASATITVRPAPARVRLNKAKATLGVKETLTLTATLSPSNAFTTLTWRSSKPAVAAVSKQGVVTPKKPGTAVITVRTKNGKTAKATVTVKAAPKKVTLNKTGTVTLKKGKKLKLKATLPKDTASALTWTSSKPKVASVDQKGNVKALKKGTAVITVKTFNGKTAKVTVTVK